MKSKFRFVNDNFICQWVTVFVSKKWLKWSKIFGDSNDSLIYSTVTNWEFSLLPPPKKNWWHIAWTEYLTFYTFFSLSKNKKLKGFHSFIIHSFDLNRKNSKCRSVSLVLFVTNVNWMCFVLNFVSVFKKQRKNFVLFCNITNFTCYG